MPRERVTENVTVAAVGGERSHPAVRYQLRKQRVAVTEPEDDTARRIIGRVDQV